MHLEAAFSFHFLSKEKFTKIEIYDQDVVARKKLSAQISYRKQNV